MNIITTGRARFALAGAAATALVAGWWFSPLHAHAAESPAAAAPMLQHEGARLFVPAGSPLRSALVVQAALEQVVQAPFALPAAVEADPARLVKVLPPAAGRIVSLDKRLGDAVKAGDVLFRLDSADVTQALGDAAKAKAAQLLARQALARQRDLATDGIAAARELEQAHSDFDAASSDLARANARLAQLGAGTAADRVLAVRSPIAGRVIELNAAPGAWWNDPSAALMTVADLSSVFVAASADERDLGAIFVGQSVRVTLDAYPAEPLDGTVRDLGQIIDPDTRRVKVRMAFDNRGGRLRPGMFAKASFFAKAHRGLLVPASALVQSGFYTRVFVETQPWRFEPRVVTLGARVGSSYEIASGLKADERIVVKDGVLLND